MPNNEDIARGSTQDAQKEAVNVYDSKHGSYKDQGRFTSGGAKPAPCNKAFKSGGGSAPSGSSE